VKTYNKAANAYSINAVPIWPSDAHHSGRPVGVLAAQIRLSRLDELSGLGSIFTATINAQSNTGSLIDLDNRRNTGIAAMIILKTGSTHFIDHQDMSQSYRQPMLDPSQAQPLVAGDRGSPAAWCDPGNKIADN